MAFYRCKEPFSYTDHTGTPVSVGLGDIMDDRDPEYMKRAAYFEPVGGVEEATAEPGALRSLARRRGRPHKVHESKHEPLDVVPESAPDIAHEQEEANS